MARLLYRHSADHTQAGGAFIQVYCGVAAVGSLSGAGVRCCEYNDLAWLQGI